MFELGGQVISGSDKRGWTKDVEAVSDQDASKRGRVTLSVKDVPSNVRILFVEFGPFERLLSLLDLDGSH